MKSKNKKGFTLIELLVVISIIAILMAVIMPALSKAREQAKRIRCAANLKQFATAWAMYFDEYNNKLPYWKDSSGNLGRELYYGALLGKYLGHPGPQAIAPGLGNRIEVYEHHFEVCKVLICPSAPTKLLKDNIYKEKVIPVTYAFNGGFICPRDWAFAKPGMDASYLKAHV